MKFTIIVTAPDSMTGDDLASLADACRALVARRLVEGAAFAGHVVDGRFTQGIVPAGMQVEAVINLAPRSDAVCRCDRNTVNLDCPVHGLLS